MMNSIINYLIENYSAEIITSTPVKSILDISKEFSQGEMIILSNENNDFIFSHTLNGTDIRHTIFEKIIPLNDDIDFMFDDIIAIIKQYLDKQISEFNYALDGDKAQRASILKQVARIKRYEIEDLENELKDYQEKIKDTLLEEAIQAGYTINQPVVKKEQAPLCLPTGKKYYISNLEVVFQKNIYPTKPLLKFKPYVHLVIGRIESDGFTFNKNIISTDNYEKHNYFLFFDKIEIEKKQKFAIKFPDIYTNVTTFVLTNPDEFPEIDKGEIDKHQIISYYGEFFATYFTSFQSDLIRDLNDNNIKIPNYYIEFSSNGKRYAYLCLDTDKKFTMNKKRISSMIKLLKDGNPNIIELPSDYKENSRKLNGKTEHFANFLYENYKSILSQK